MQFADQIRYIDDQRRQAVVEKLCNQQCQPAVGGRGRGACWHRCQRGRPRTVRLAAAGAGRYVGAGHCGDGSAAAGSCAGIGLGCRFVVHRGFGLVMSPAFDQSPDALMQRRGVGGRGQNMLQGFTLAGGGEPVMGTFVFADQFADHRTPLKRFAILAGAQLGEQAGKGVPLALGDTLLDATGGACRLGRVARQSGGERLQAACREGLLWRAAGHFVVEPFEVRRSRRYAPLRQQPEGLARDLGRVVAVDGHGLGRIRDSARSTALPRAT